MKESQERELLARISSGGSESWRTFLDACSGLIFRVACLFEHTYDGRMDLFLQICARLKDDRMRRVRAFTERKAAPCRFSTFVAVVARDIAVDCLRSREGRSRSVPPDRSRFTALPSDLSPSHLLALTLRFRDGLSTQETAEFMSIAPEEARRLTTEGLRALRERLRRARAVRTELDPAGVNLQWRS